MERKPHLLVVDDVPDNLDLLVQMLADTHRVTTAVDGHAAIARIEADRPDLLLLDLMMPVMDGFGVLAYLQANPTPFLPVIVLTANTEHSERLRALRAGAHEFLTKPVDDEELSARIGTLLTLKAARDEVTAQNDELRRAKAVAEEAARFKGMFLATMSHEIRTPLTAIIGFAETLQEPGRTAREVAEAQRIILRSGKHLLHIINDILDMSKLEAGGVDVEQAPCSLFGLLGDVESIIGSNAREKGIAFVLEPCFPLPAHVTSDATRIKQILLNLCSNAIKFTHEGEVRLRVSCAGEVLTFSVADTGIGMAPDQLERLFQPFTQADATTTRRYGGTGLGLYISRKLAEALGGSLTAASTPGVGSRFDAAISTGPLADVAWLDHQDHEPAVSRALAPEQIPDLAGARILLAEDTPANQRLIAHYVRQTGATVAVVEDGGQAVEEALGGDYDLVLMDMQMPVVDGLEATMLLRKIGFARPIIALTANVLKEDVAAYLRAGCTACLAKPIDRAQFFSQLAKHLGSLSPDRTALVDDEPLLRELAEQFATELPAAQAAIAAAAGSEDWPLVRSLAHKLRGTAGSLGFSDVYHIASRIEDALRADRPADALAALSPWNERNPG
ncbi:MAG: chemotaxis protein CheY [Cyanobacteria bacterium RYN_339]|nr:chemotaxis protein CheY [Cyanobacteria bacterium RYN_339]